MLFSVAFDLISFFPICFLIFFLNFQFRVKLSVVVHYEVIALLPTDSFYMSMHCRSAKAYMYAFAD